MSDVPSETPVFDREPLGCFTGQADVGGQRSVKIRNKDQEPRAKIEELQNQSLEELKPEIKNQ